MTERRSQTPAYDDLPSFAELTNDEDRERKAESKAPGTFNVIVNPESFVGLPEYGLSADARSPKPSSRSGRNSIDSRSSTEMPRSRPRAAGQDPNVVVLAKFEDSSLSLPSLATFPVDRMTSLPDNLHRLDISGSLQASSLTPGRRNDSVTQGVRDERLMVHYRGFISKRIFPLAKDIMFDRLLQEDPIVAEAREFPPVSYDAQTTSRVALFPCHCGETVSLYDASQRLYHAILNNSSCNKTASRAQRFLASATRTLLTP